MQQQAPVPITYAIKRIHMCFPSFLYPFKTGIKNPWIENALPIMAANPAIPVPKAGIVAGPEGRVDRTQIKNMRQPTILAIPQPIICAPKSKNFSTMHQINRKAALMNAFARVKSYGGTNPYHCRTIRSKQSIKINTIPIHTQKSQNILRNLLPLKCLKRAESRSFWSPRCITARQHEQKLNKPVTAITMIVKAHPACMEVSGMTRIDPPIIPLTNATTVVGRLSYL